MGIRGIDDLKPEIGDHHKFVPYPDWRDKAHLPCQRCGKPRQHPIHLEAPGKETEESKDG